MEQVSPSGHRLPIALLVALAITGLTAAAFYGWIAHGSLMMLTLGDLGLSGCL
ncbi:hypothetical protein ABID21_001284 [Pseudorhizobium tarimense]|uniref:Uncharacterized protein n=1 Tax=Pseudorhizobium tarimense TaxID=1079109 RepID=A0ABV2H445_9HYPH|nr:hypothetical protein [Pseudorhizobium tarimense]MCJ8518401.1 hypothetical protein [Pseudorhizobium tarimense]